MCGFVPVQDERKFQKFPGMEILSFDQLWKAEQERRYLKTAVESAARERLRLSSCMCQELKGHMLV